MLVNSLSNTWMIKQQEGRLPYVCLLANDFFSVRIHHSWDLARSAGDLSRKHNLSEHSLYLGQFDHLAGRSRVFEASDFADDESRERSRHRLITCATFFFTVTRKVRKRNHALLIDFRLRIQCSTAEKWYCVFLRGVCRCSFAWAGPRDTCLVVYVCVCCISVYMRA